MDKTSAATFLMSPLKMGPIISQIHDFIGEGLKQEPEYFGLPLKVISSGKSLIGADLLAEQKFSSLVKANGRKELISVEGEENLASRDLDLTGSAKIHILCDIIDGTDLFVRGFSNWCSAIVVFSPSEKSVICSNVYAVGDRGATLFSANRDSELPVSTLYREVMVEKDYGPPVAKPFSEPTSVSVKGGVPLSRATICCYGQKFKNLHALGKLFEVDAARDFLLSPQMENSRFHTLAGNPMMCRIIDGSVDIVFDVFGQAPHDVVPGAYIALKAGAVMYDLGDSPKREDRTVLVEDFVEFRYKPNNERMKYVIARDHPLALEFLSFAKQAGVF